MCSPADSNCWIVRDKSGRQGKESRFTVECSLQNYDFSVFVLFSSDSFKHKKHKSWIKQFAPAHNVYPTVTGRKTIATHIAWFRPSQLLSQLYQAFSITISIGSGLLNHYLNCIRPSQSRLYRPTDSFEDLSIVTTDLQSSLGREKVIGFVETFKKYLIGFLCQALEDKLINIKNIVIKHSESADFSGPL